MAIKLSELKFITKPVTKKKTVSKRYKTEIPERILERRKRKKKRQEQIEKAKKYTAEKLKEVEEYGTKTLKKVGKRLEKVDITKEPKGYKQLQKGVERLFAQPKKRKVSSSELKRRRDFELKKMKLAHQQRMDYLQAQAEATAQAQDPRFNPNPAEDQFLAEAQPEYPREEEYYGEDYPQEQQNKKRFFDRFGRLISKGKRSFQQNRVNARSMLAYENKFNRPFNPDKGNKEITLMNTNTKAPQLNFMGGVTTQNLYKNIPAKLTKQKNIPTKITFLSGTK